MTAPGPGEEKAEEAEEAGALLLEYCRRGWRLLPVWGVEQRAGAGAGVGEAGVGWACACGRLDCEAPGKHPHVRGWKDVATADWETVQGWAGQWPGCNWAVATGAGSGLVVVDCDLHETDDGWASLNNWLQGHGGYELPETVLARTGSGGTHVYLQHPALLGGSSVVRNAVRWLPGVDLRADGGYVLLPRSRHVSGREYEWLALDGVEVAAPAAWLALELSQARGAGNGARSGTDDGDRPEYDYAEAKRSGPRAGGRDDFFHAYSWELRKCGVARGEAERLLREAWERCEQPAGDVFGWERALGKLNANWQAVEPDAPLDWEWKPRQAGGGGGDGDTGDEGRDAALDGINRGGPTDTGNAERLAAWYGEDLRHTEGKHGGTWRRWDGLVWVTIPQADVLDVTKKVVTRLKREVAAGVFGTRTDDWAIWTKTSASEARRRAMMNLGGVELHVPREAWDQHEMLLPVGNGVVDLRTGELIEARREQHTTLQSFVDYRPGTRSMELDTFLRHVTNGDLEFERYLQRAVGYTLTSSTREDSFFVMYGPTGTGKSTFMSGVETCLGQYAGSTSASTILETKNPTSNALNSLAVARGKRLLWVMEPPEGARLNEHLVKSIAGGDPIEGKILYEDQQSFRPTYKLWVATNHSPRVDDDASWRRARRLPFKQSVHPEAVDKGLRERLQDASSELAQAFLAWAVQGCLDWQTEGLGTCEVVAWETAEWKSEEDRLGQFMEENVVRVAGGKLPMALLYPRYAAWTVDAGERPMGKSRLSKKLVEAGWALDKTSRTRDWLGIELRPLDVNAFGL